MKSLQHVMWRGALALGLVSVGVGSGIGMPSAEASKGTASCAEPTRVMVVRGDATVLARHASRTALAAGRGPSPVDSES